MFSWSNSTYRILFLYLWSLFHINLDTKFQNLSQFLQNNTLKNHLRIKLELLEISRSWKLDSTQQTKLKSQTLQFLISPGFSYGPFGTHSNQSSATFPDSLSLPSLVSTPLFSSPPLSRAKQNTSFLLLSHIQKISHLYSWFRHPHTNVFSVLPSTPNDFW